MFIQKPIQILLVLYCTTGFAASIGDKAPECPLNAIGTDRVLSTSEYKGKVLYLDFWASWCSTCRVSFPHLNKLRNEMHSQGFELIGINVDENQEDANEFLAKYPIDFVIGLNPSGSCPELFNVMAMPTSYIIDKTGMVRHVHVGFNEDDIPNIRTIIQTLLAENE